MERSREPMNKNRIEGDADQGERAKSREALVVKGRRRRSGGCAVKDCVLTWGDLALCLKGRRRQPEREVSRGRSSRFFDEGLNERERRRPSRCDMTGSQMPAKRGADADEKR